MKRAAFIYAWAQSSYVLREGIHTGRHPYPNQVIGCPLGLLSFSRRYENDYMLSPSFSSHINDQHHLSATDSCEHDQ